MINIVPKPIKQKKVSKVAKWSVIRKELIKEFRERGIIRCEIGLPGCTSNNFLGFAHTRKRRNVTDLKKVVLACVFCHSKVEYNCKELTGKNMEDLLENIIDSRV